MRKAGICIGSMTRRTQAVNITEQWLLGESCQVFRVNNLIPDNTEHVCVLLGDTAHGDRYLDVSKLMWQSQGDHMRTACDHKKVVH